MKVTSKINIDLRHPNPGVRVDAVQGDVNTRAVEISLFDGGSAWKVPSGVTAALAYKKPDSQQGCLDGSASVTVSGSTITIVMTKQMLATPGTVNACVVLTDAAKNQLTAFPFSVSVAANPAADVQQSDEPIKVDTSDATAAAGDIVAGKTAYVDGKKVTGTHACPEGLDTSDATAVAADILAGKTAYVNGQKVTGSIASRSAQTITPGTADQTIASGQYLSGKQTIKGDANLLPGNIKSGVTVFGVDGAYVGTVDIDTSDATAAAEDITKGKTAYVNGEKVTGTHECPEGLDTSDATATAEDMADGKTAYVNGEKITGTIPLWSSWSWNNATPSWDDENSTLKLNGTAGARRFVEKNAPISMRCDPSKLGDATASDVAAGKTFTSSAGLKVTGTHACPESIDTSDATAAAEDIADGKTAYVNGQKVTGTHVCQVGTGGLTVKTGTTTSNVINTGLSSVWYIFLNATSTLSSAGLKMLMYADGKAEGMIRTSDQSASYNSFSNNSYYGSVDGGTFKWNGNSYYAMVDGIEYKWIAFGIE